MGTTKAKSPPTHPSTNPFITQLELCSGGWIATVTLNGKILFSCLEPSQQAARDEAEAWCQTYRRHSFARRRM